DLNRCLRIEGPPSWAARRWVCSRWRKVEDSNLCVLSDHLFSGQRRLAAPATFHNERSPACNKGRRDELALPLSYRPIDGGPDRIRTRNPALRRRCSPLLHLHAGNQGLASRDKERRDQPLFAAPASNPAPGFPRFTM